MAARRAADNLARHVATNCTPPTAIIPPGIRWPIVVRRFSFPRCPFGNKWLDVRLKRFFCDGLDARYPIG